MHGLFLLNASYLIFVLYRRWARGGERPVNYHSTNRRNN